jgi:hypothetical protein
MDDGRTEDQMAARTEDCYCYRTWNLCPPCEEQRTQESDTEPECEHGLSAWLCAGPMHYPADAR